MTSIIFLIFFSRCITYKTGCVLALCAGGCLLHHEKFIDRFSIKEISRIRRAFGGIRYW